MKLTSSDVRSVLPYQMYVKAHQYLHSQFYNFEESEFTKHEKQTGTFTIRCPVTSRSESNTQMGTVPEPEVCSDSEGDSQETEDAKAEPPLDNHVPTPTIPLIKVKLV